MKPWLGVLLLAAGCDRLFEIHSIDPAVPDAPKVYLDSMVDAQNCGMHDEDGDLVNDKCDKCPSIDDPGDADSDNDGVGDRCDPDPGPANFIDEFYSFANGIGLDGTGATYPQDTLKLNDGDNAVTARNFNGPEVIDVTIAALNPGANINIIVNPGASNITCELLTTCAGPSTCLFLAASSGEMMQVPLTFQPSELSSLVLYRTGDGTVHCSVNDLAQVHTATLVGPAMPSGKIELLSLNGTTTLSNAIVYNLR